MSADFQLYPFGLKMAGNELQAQCHGASMAAGWWTDRTSGLDLLAVVRGEHDGNPIIKRLGKALVAEKLALVHSEVSEAMEGHRKGLPDDKLPQYPMAVVELADAVIRAGDLVGAIIPPDAGYTFGDVIAAKMAFNAIRPDHKPEARAAEGGKAY